MNKLKTFTASQRIKEFSGEFLTTSGKGGARLFCNACREELIVSHVLCNKHKVGKSLNEARERDIPKLLKANDKSTHPVGETLPMEQRVYRVKPFMCSYPTI